MLSEKAHKRLAGLWGAYDFTIIRDKHFATASDMVERFLEKYERIWNGSSNTDDVELNKNRGEVRRIVTEWAERKVANCILAGSVETIRSHIMFKQLHYGRGHCINFGSTGLNWNSKTDIAQELSRYRPWSIAHAIAHIGDKEQLYSFIKTIVQQSGSPSEIHFFEKWWDLTDNPHRPMLFPQVHGNTSGKFWLKKSENEVVPVHFDFGLVNVERRNKVLIECDSRRYHSNDKRTHR
jgi:hypothetical protein